MTEPGLASSDATNIESTIKREGDHYVINGRKWWSSGSPDRRCKIIIFMGKTDPENPDRHRIFVKQGANGGRHPHPERPCDHGGEGEKRDGELQDELNEHGPRAGDKAENEYKRQAYREREDQKQLPITKES